MGVQELRGCELWVTDRSWSFADRNSVAIDAHWRAAIERNSALFDGDVFMVESWSVDDDVLRGQVMRAKFSAYLFWRETSLDQGVGDEAFATTMVVAADGGVLLGRSVAGTLNQGLYLSPGGLIDARDVVCDKGEMRLDPARAAERELYEETGLVGRDMQRETGWRLVRAGPFLGLVSIYRSAVSGVELKAQVETFLARQAQPELEDVRVVNGLADVDGLRLTPFAELLLPVFLK